MASRSFMFLDGLDMFKSGNSHGSAVSYSSGAMELDEWEFKFEQEGSQEGGKPRSVERVKHDELLITRRMDSRSPKLFYYCCSATFLNSATLNVFSTTSDPFLTITLSWVHVSSYEPKSGEGVPIEKVGFRFGEMTMKWNDSALGGADYGFTNSGNISTRWSWVFETPTQINPHLPEITT